jgi:hypothetical protein
METTQKIYGEGSAFGETGSSRPGAVTDDVNVGTIERWASVALAATFAIVALRRGGPTGALLMLSGGGLLLRGITGHCHAYGALGIDTAGGSEAWSPERSSYGSQGSGYGSQTSSHGSPDPGWAPSSTGTGAESTRTTGESFGGGHGARGERGPVERGEGREGDAGPTQVRSFELHASDEGIHGTGTDRTEPYPRT